MTEIIYKGDALPIHFGMKALSHFSKMQNVSFDKTVTDPSNSIAGIDSIVELGVFGFNEGARRSGNSKRYTLDDVWDMIEDAPELIFEISEAFAEAITPLTDKISAMGKKVPSATKKKKESQ